MSWQWRVIGLLMAVSVLAGFGQTLPSTALPVPAVASVHAGTQPAQPLRAPLRGLPVSVVLPGPDEPVVPAPPPPATTPDCRTLKCVALTFDDGPVAGTRTLLALLRRKHVHATFFLLGAQAKAHPDIVRRMVADGHVIGNHSWNHPEFWGLSARAIRRQLVRTDRVLRAITGRRPTLMRPPFGELNGRVKRVARSRGDALVLWDVDPLDWKDRRAKTVAARVVRDTRRGSIVLSHDVWPSTRHAYGRIIDRLRAEGFTLVTVPELLGSPGRAGKVYLRH